MRSSAPTCHFGGCCDSGKFIFLSDSLQARIVFYVTVLSLVPLFCNANVILVRIVCLKFVAK